MSDDQNKNEEQKEKGAPETAPTPEPAVETTQTTEATDASDEETTEPENTAETEVVSDQVEELPYQDLKPGMVVRVSERILDVSPKGEARERIQVFEGLIIGMKNAGIARTITVRKDSKGWMVEKIYPLASPNVTKIEVVKQYRVRRAKLNYLKKSTKRGNKNRRFKRKLKEIKSEK